MSNTENPTVVIPIKLARFLLTYLSENAKSRSDIINLNELRRCLQASKVDQPAAEPARQASEPAVATTPDLLNRSQD